MTTWFGQHDPSDAKGFSVHGTDGMLGEVVGGFRGSRDFVVADTFDGMKAFDADSIDRVDWGGKSIYMAMHKHEIGGIPDIQIVLQRELTEEEIREIERKLGIK
jgi:hypothetical protein